MLQSLLSFLSNLSRPAFLFFVFIVLGHLITFSYPSRCSLIGCVLLFVFNFVFNGLMILLLTWLIDRVYYYGTLGYLFTWGCAFITGMMILNSLYLVTSSKSKRDPRSKAKKKEEEEKEKEV